MSNAIIQKDAHLTCFGGWGEPAPPAFAYELSGPALASRAVKNNVARYGPKPGNGEDDARPLALGIVGVAASSASFAPLDGAPAFQEITQQNGKLFSQPVVKFADTAPRQWQGASVAQNAALDFDFFAHPRDGDGVAITSWRWGVAGAGALFQLRDGRAEFGHLSKLWNDTEYLQLILLWQLGSPTGAETDQQNELEAKLFDGFGSISGDFVGVVKRVQIVAEPRGVAHITSAGETTSIENRARLDDLARVAEAGEPVPALWAGGPMTVLTTGQSFYFRYGVPQFAATGTLIYGPFKTGYFADSLGDLAYGINSSRLAAGDIVIERTGQSETSVFYFKLTINRQSDGQSPWLYGISARLAPGARNGSNEISFDSDDLYAPVGELEGTGETDPIMEIEPTWEGGSRGTTRRGAVVTFRDVLGRTSTPKAAGRAIPKHRVGNLDINNTRFLTNAIVTNVRQPDVGAFSRAELGQTMNEQTADFIAKPDTNLVITLSDGWTILDEMLCKSAPVGDGLHLGGYLRELLKLAGFTAPQMAGVGAGEGPRLPRGALGDGFAVQAHSDTSISSAINAALDVRGYGLVFYQDCLGAWQLKRPGANAVRAFQGHTAAERDVILQPLDIEHDIQDFYNDFSVVCGKNGEIVRNYTSWESIRQANHVSYIGRKKTYTAVVDSSVLTEAGAEYALRSLVWRNGRLGRRATFETYFHTDLDIGDRLSLGGGKWELLAPSGGSWANDTMQFYCLEVA